MNKLEYEKLILPLVNLINDIEMDLVRNILNRIDNYDGIKGSLKWYTDKLVELKLLDKENIKVFDKNKNYFKKIIEDIAEGFGNHIDNLENLEKYYKKGLINVNPISFYESIAVNNLINEAISDTYDIMDLIKTKAIEGANEAYKNILNKAYIETSSGVYTYTEAIRKAIDEFSNSGIKAAHYKDGRSITIEAVTRRDVITRMNKLVGDCELEHAKELDTNLVYVDQHLGARVRTEYTKHDYEAHDEWQGKKYMIVGSNEKYDNLYDKTGYGEMLGLKGINCYHNMRPTWEWEEIHKQIDLKENAKVREILDKRNYYARKIRNLKHKKLNARMLNDSKEYKKISYEYIHTNQKYNLFLKENNLIRDYNREYITKKIINNTKNDNYTNITKEWLETAKPNSHKVVDRQYFEYDGIKYNVDNKNVVLDYSSKEKDVAEWLENTFGGEIYMIPRVNNPEGIQTADYLFRGEYWDLKSISGKSKQVLYHSIYKKKTQSNNFIFDVVSPELDINELQKQIYKLYNRKDTEFLQKIILKKENDIFVYKRK